MKITIRILSIVSAVIAFFNTIAYLVILSIRPILITTYYAGAPEIAETSNEILPIGATVSILSVLILTVISCIIFCNTRIKPWADIIAALFLLFPLPLIRHIIDIAQATAIATKGMYYVAALSNIQSLISIPIIISSFSVSLSLIACGMSIAYKSNLKTKDNIYNE